LPSESSSSLSKAERLTKLAMDLANLAQEYPRHEAIDALDIARILFRKDPISPIDFGPKDGQSLLDQAFSS
jgi:hypothetical protein